MKFADIYYKYKARRDVEMKIIIENIPAGSEPEIIIKCNEPDESLLQLIYSLKSSSKKLIGFNRFTNAYYQS